MSRLHVDPPARVGPDPAAARAPAWKDKRMNAILILHREFELAIEGRVAGVLPHPGWIHHLTSGAAWQNEIVDPPRLSLQADRPT
jgi:hypothetical protein